MTPAQLKFARFKSGPIGRTIDITLGLSLLWYGSDFASLFKTGLFVVGVFAFLAGFLNVCWAAPILGVPFLGKNVPKTD